MEKDKSEVKPYFPGITPEMDDPKVYWKGERRESEEDVNFWIMKEEDMERARKGVERFMSDTKNWKWLAERVGAWTEHIARYQKWLAEQKASGR